jgi:hypothetical protein
MLFLAVEQKYLHGWKAGDVEILYERPGWMTDLKHTDSALFSKVTQVNSL